MYTAGIDIGGTTVKIGIFKDSVLVAEFEIKTDTSENGKNILGDISKAVIEKLEELGVLRTELAAAGVGIPGPVTADGTVLKCVNLGWGVFNVEEALGGFLGVPVAAGNDANVAALGEFYDGAGSGFDSAVMVTLGTGVGGGVVLGGKLLCGATGSAGEIGHIHVNDDETQRCSCGNYGCLEQYSSATGLVRMAAKTGLPEFQNVSAKDVFDMAKSGNKKAGELVDTFNRYLGCALANVSSVVNPEVFIIGGGVSKAGEIITDGVKKYYDKYVFHSCRDVKFVTAALSNSAGIHGAARLALTKLLTC